MIEETMSRPTAELQTIKTELAATHPVTGAYSSDDETAANQLNAVNVTRERQSITGAEVYNALDPTEFQALTAAQQTRVRDIFGLGGDIDIRTGKNARNVLLSLFNGASTTRANLVAIVQEPCSRAVVLNLGTVTPSDVADARRLP